MLLLPCIVQIRVLVGDHHQKLPDSLSEFFLSHLCFRELSLNRLQGKKNREEKRKIRQTTSSADTILVLWSGDYPNENLKVIRIHHDLFFIHCLSPYLYFQFWPREKSKLMWKEILGIGYFWFHSWVQWQPWGNTHLSCWQPVLWHPPWVGGMGNSTWWMQQRYVSYYESHFRSQQKWHSNCCLISNLHTILWCYIPFL